MRNIKALALNVSNQVGGSYRAIATNIQMSVGPAMLKQIEQDKADQKARLIDNAVTVAAIVAAFALVALAWWL